MQTIEELIRKESKSAESCEKALAVFHEMMSHENAIVSISVEDVAESLTPGSEVTGWEFSVASDAADRMAQLVEQFSSATASHEAFKTILFNIICPKAHEIIMDEMSQLSAELNEKCPDANIVWAYATCQEEAPLRALFLCQ